LAELWDSHVVLRQLARTAHMPLTAGPFGTIIHLPVQLPDYNEPIRPKPPGTFDPCGPIAVPNVGGFVPLIRHSLYTACALDILFLRHEEPFALMKQGGDLDGRLKTLFDGLRMPDPRHQYVGADPVANPLDVVRVDDALVSDLSIRSGGLLERFAS
jgi:hypothetical protein